MYIFRFFIYYLFLADHGDNTEPMTTELTNLLQNVLGPYDMTCMDGISVQIYTLIIISIIIL